MKIPFKLLISALVYALFGAAAAGGPVRIFETGVQPLTDADASSVANIRCQEVNDRRVASADEIAVQQIIAPLDEELTGIYKSAPDVFMFWIRFDGKLSLLSLPAASHESLHYITKRERHCRQRGSLFVFQRSLYEIGVPRELTPNISDVVAEWPRERIPKSRNARFFKYLVEAKGKPDSDFYLLLEEWVSYISGAAVEVGLQSYYHRNDLLFGLSANAVLDGELSGALDFTAFLSRYLALINKSDPNLYRAIVVDVGVKSLACSALGRLGKVLAQYFEMPAERKSMTKFDPGNLADVAWDGVGKIAVDGIRCEEQHLPSGLPLRPQIS